MTGFLIKLFIKNSEDVKNINVRKSYGTLGSIVGIACNILLCLIKITVGLTTASISIVADGLNNLSDMGSSIITMIGFKLAGKPADSDHPFGHGRIEYMSAFLVAMLIILVGFELVTSSVKTLISGESAPVYSAVSIIVLCVSVVIKFWMFLFNRKIGRKIKSDALIATAQDSVNDSIATLVILISVVISILVSVPFNLDAVMAAAVGLFIIWSGISSAKDTLNSILGGPPERELIEDIENTILSFEEFVGIHDLIVHNYGPGRQFASVHVEVPQNIDIVRCHEQIDLCEKIINEKLDILLVIHMDPIDTDNASVLQAKEAILGEIHKINEKLSLHDFRMTPSGENRTNLIFDVVVPSAVKMSFKELNEKICEAAKIIDPTYCCVITFDNDFTGI
ncbi:MAG: cation transporter [Clostridia bacterium]|nr:cation transporter [Clostridia bacterium]